MVIRLTRSICFVYTWWEFGRVPGESERHRRNIDELMKGRAADIAASKAVLENQARLELWKAFSRMATACCSAKAKLVAKVATCQSTSRKNRDIVPEILRENGLNEGRFGSVEVAEAAAEAAAAAAAANNRSRKRTTRWPGLVFEEIKRAGGVGLGYDDTIESGMTGDAGDFRTKKLQPPLWRAEVESEPWQQLP